MNHFPRATENNIESFRIIWKIRGDIRSQDDEESLVALPL